MSISINQIATGMGLFIGDDIYIVIDYSHVKPGKGSAFARVKLRNIKTDQIIERTFKTAEKLEEVPLEERKLQNLYQKGDTFHFMDLGSYEEHIVHEDVVGGNVKFLQENLEVSALTYNNKILKIMLPMFIVAEIKHTEPGIKGDSSKSGTKPATIDTGAIIQVPLFIDLGDVVKIDTRTSSYVERVKK